MSPFLMRIQEDKQIVTRSMVILFLTLTIVYSLVYMRKSDLFTASPTLPEVTLSGTGLLPTPVVSGTGNGAPS